MTIDELSAQLNTRFDQIDARFEQVDARFDRVDARFEQVDARFEQMDARFEQMDARFEQMDARFEQVDARFDRVDARFVVHDTYLLDLRAEMLQRLASIDRHLEGVISDENTLRIDYGNTKTSLQALEARLFNQEQRCSRLERIIDKLTQPAA